MNINRKESDMEDCMVTFEFEIQWRSGGVSIIRPLAQWPFQSVASTVGPGSSCSLDQHQATASDMPGINRWRNEPGPADSFHWPTKPRTVKPANPGLLIVAPENHRLGRFDAEL